MERYDYHLADDPTDHYKTVNVANRRPHELARFETYNKVVLSANHEEMELLLRGLRVLASQTQINAWTSGRIPDTRLVDRLIEDIEAPSPVEEGVPLFFYSSL